MTATLTVKRETRMVLELRRGTFDVMLDGVIVGSIDRDEAFETSVEPGRHQLQVWAGRYSSRPRSFDAADGDAVTFRCSGARIWPVYLASLVKPDLAIPIKRE